jgi:WD40 repeat protein
MVRRKRRHLLGAGLFSLTLATVLVSRLHCPGNRPGEDKGKCIVLEGQPSPIQALAFDPDGATMTVACFTLRDPQGWEVAVWDVRAGNPTARRAEHPDAARCLAIAPGGRTLAVAGQDQSLWLCETAPPRRRRSEEHSCHIDALAYSRDGGWLAATDAAGVVTLWDVAGGWPRSRCKGAAAPVRALALAPDGTNLAGGGSDNAVWLWDLATGEERGILPGHPSAVVSLAFAPDSRTLASGHLNGVVTLWDVAAQTKRTTLEAATDKVFLSEVSALAFSPDGRTLAVAVSRTVQLWDVASGRRVASLEGHAGKVLCLAYAPDGKCLASGSRDRTVRLWDVTQYRTGAP